MPIFEFGWTIPVKNHVWKFGLNWLKSEVCEFSRREKPPIKRGYMWPAMPIFELGRAIPVNSQVWKFGSDWLSISRVIVSTDKHKKSKASRLWYARRGAYNNRKHLKFWESSPWLIHMVSISSKSEVFDFSGGRSPLLGECTIIERTWSYGNLPYFWLLWFEFHKNRRYLNFPGGQNPSISRGLHLTCDAHFRTQMSYSSQSLCVEIWFGLVEIGDMLIFRGRGWGGGRRPILWGLHVTCDAHFWTWPSYSSQKSCVKFWFGLAEPFRSYRGNIHKEKK